MVIKIPKSCPSAGPLRAKAGYDTRQEILDAAAEIFSEVGFRATSVTLIAKRVGIKPPSLYTYFKSKNQILYIVVKEAFLQLVDVCEEAVNNVPVDDPKNQLIAFVQAHVEILLVKRGAVPMMDSVMYRGPSQNAGLKRQQLTVLFKLQRKIFDMLKEILSRGKKKGIMDFRDLTVTTFAILGIIEHSAYWHRSGGRLSTDEAAQELALLSLNTAKIKE